MNCPDFSRLIHAYLDQELDLMTSLDLEAHIEACACCRAQHAGLRELRRIEARHLQFHAAPQALRDRIAQGLRQAPRENTRARAAPWRAATAVLGLALAALLAWIALPTASHVASAQPVERIVYHLADNSDVDSALRNVANHLAATPSAKVVVVTHNQGVDFLLRGARNRDGKPYEPAVAQLAVRGVEFRICQNTLTRRDIGAEAVIPEARLVPSGIAEISRLQTQEGYAYMKL